MSYDMNQWLITGRIHQAPIVSKKTQAVVQFTVIAMVGYNDMGQPKYLKHRVACFNGIAKQASTLKAGDAVLVQGALNYQHWQHEGKDHYGTRLVAHQVMSFAAMPVEAFEEPPVSEGTSLQHSTVSDSQPVGQVNLG